MSDLSQDARIDARADMPVVGASMRAHLDAVEHLGEGQYSGMIDAGWGAPLLPYGGLVVAVGLRALERELAKGDQHLRSVTTAFVGQVEPGEVVVDTKILRRGRTASQGCATVRNPGAAAGHTSLATFGVERAGFQFVDLEVPAVPGPHLSLSYRDMGPPVNAPWAPLLDRVDVRLAEGRAWDDPAEDRPGSSRRAVWVRYDDDAAMSQPWDSPSVVALCDMMVGATRQRVGPRPESWVAPSADLTVHLLDRPTGEWLLSISRCLWAGAGYASSTLELWDMERSRPVALANQVMLFRFLQESRLPAAGGRPASETRCPT